MSQCYFNKDETLFLQALITGYQMNGDEQELADRILKKLRGLK